MIFFLIPIYLIIGLLTAVTWAKYINLKYSKERRRFGNRQRKWSDDGVAVFVVLSPFIWPIFITYLALRVPINFLFKKLDFITTWIAQELVDPKNNVKRNKG